MYKVIAVWSAPKPEDEQAFEDYYLNVHVPLAEKVPGMERLVLTRTADGLEGSPPAFFRLAELLWEDVAAFEASEQTAEWRALREDAGGMLERFAGVTLTVASGVEDVRELAHR